MKYAAVLIPLLTVASVAAGLERFPPPEFENYQIPTASRPEAPSWWGWVDVGVLVGELIIVSALVLVVRRRRGVFVAMLAMLLYWGFWRGGCICPIGAIGNVADGLFNPGYLLPLFVLLFFLVPIIFTLLFGRTFCGAVCPLGGIQDAVLIHPLRVPRWLEVSLSTLAWVYLGLAVLLAATNSGYIICRYDPFVRIFRFSGMLNFILFGVLFLVLCAFVGRAYCRFLCPLGALFRPLGRLSRHRVRITPDDCVKCRLCENACPFDAILPPTEASESVSRGDKTRLVGAIAAFPLLIALGVGAGALLRTPLSKLNYTVRLAEEVRLRETGEWLVENERGEKVPREATETDPSESFRAHGGEAEELYARAAAIREEFYWGGMILGGFLGLVIACKLLRFALPERRKDWTAEPGRCVSCGRCMDFCPVEHKRRGDSGGEETFRPV